MDRYIATMREDTTTTGFITAGIIGGVAARRGRIYELTLSCEATPAEKVINWKIQRSTSLGTTTPVTPAEVDLDGPAAALVAGESASAEPTYTASQELWQNDLNQRATFLWKASPYGDWLVPASATAGIGFQAKSPDYTGVLNISAAWVE